MAEAEKAGLRSTFSQSLREIPEAERWALLRVLAARRLVKFKPHGGDNSGTHRRSNPGVGTAGAHRALQPRGN